MSIYLKSGLLGAALLLCQPVWALDFVPFSHEASVLDKLTLTHTDTPELKPIPSQSFQLAAAQFLPEAAESVFANHREIDKDYNKGDCTKLNSLFTTKNCSYPYAVLAASKCALRPGYYKECICLPQFKLSTCPAPKFASSPQCEGKFESCLCPASVSLNNPNDKCTQYCDGKCIAKSCTPTPDETDCQFGTTTEDDGCGGNRTVCKACTLSDCTNLSSKPDNSYFITSSCTDCFGTKTVNSGWECISGYHKSGSICAANCSLPNCSNAVSSKPANSSYTTASCTDCSGSKTIYSGWSCNSGYIQSGNSCVINSKYRVGDILNSDMTITSTKVSGKTPIGIVFDPIRQLAVSLDQSIQTAYIGDVKKSSGLTAFPVEEFPNTASKEEAVLDFNGETNTQKILNTCKKYKMECALPYFVENYQPAGTKGWYIPAVGEILNLLYVKDEVGTVLNQLSATPLAGYYWTSSFTKYYNGTAWERQFRTDVGLTGIEGTMNDIGWGDDYVQWWPAGIVRPIIKF